MGYKYTDEVHKLVAFKYEDKGGTDQWFDGIDKAVLLNLAGRANNETGECHPGYSRIAADTIFSRKSVERSVGVLRHIGFITVVPPGERKTTTYTLNLKLILDIVMAQDEGKLDKKPKRKGNFKKHVKEPVKFATVVSTPAKSYSCAICGEKHAAMNFTHDTACKTGRRYKPKGVDEPGLYKCIHCGKRNATKLGTSGDCCKPKRKGVDIAKEEVQLLDEPKTTSFLCLECGKPEFAFEDADMCQCEPDPTTEYFEDDDEELS